MRRPFAKWCLAMALHAERWAREDALAGHCGGRSCHENNQRSGCVAASSRSCELRLLQLSVSNALKVIIKT